MPSYQTIYNWIHSDKITIKDTDLRRKKYKGSGKRVATSSFR